jgi:hypothetical protein
VKPGQRLSREQAYRLPIGSVVRDRSGALWMLRPARYSGAPRRWAEYPGYGAGMYATGALFRFRAPITFERQGFPKAPAVTP